MAQRVNYLVVNEVTDAKQTLEKINGDIAQPYAQIIVLDAALGDSNVIDLCRVPLNQATGNYATTKDNIPTYYRALIDTGPNNAHLTNVQRVLTTFGQPAVRGTTGQKPVYPPKGFDNAVLEMFQLSHMDDDHSGQAVPLLNSIASEPTLAKSWVNTPVLFHDAPKLNPNMTIGYDNNYIVPNNGPIQFACEIDEKWLGRIQAAGIRPTYAWYWQSMDQDDSDLIDANWTEFSGQHAPELLSELTLGNIQPANSSTYPPYMAIQCRVKLQEFVKIGDSKTTKWRYLQARRQNGPAPPPPTPPPKKPKKPKEPDPPPYEMQDVVWRNDAVFKVKPYQQGAPKSLLKYTLESSNLPHAGHQYGAATIFAEIESAIVRSNNDWKNMNPRPSPKPWVSSVIPDAIQGRFVRNVSEAWGCAVVGPTEDVYSELIRFQIVARYASAWTTVLNQTTGQGAMIGPYNLMKNRVEGDGYMDIENRASIVTLFRRFELYPNGLRNDDEEPPFEMLFTGDAYDRDCQISSTVAAFDGNLKPKYVSVLKIPHHGSKKTSDTHFYAYFRAQVYLVCGQQSYHGNPSIVTLETIAKGFKQSDSLYAKTRNNPYLIFFSSPVSLSKVENEDSHVYTLMNESQYRPYFTPGNASRPIYNYRCFMLRPAPPDTKKEKYRSAGRIVFGSTVYGDLAVQFTVTDDPTDMTDYALNDWVEIMPAP